MEQNRELFTIHSYKNGFLPQFRDHLQAAMVSRWRADWGDSEAKMPFYYVLIAPYARGENSYMRGYFIENQASAAKIIPNCKFASAETYGSKECIHPADKRPISRQLAMLAMSDLYGIEGINAGVPEIVNIKLEGNKYIVEFEHGKGLMTPPYEAVAGFEVAGEDKLFYPAKAKLRGDKIEVTVPQEITSPQSLRYSFRDYDIGNVRSRFGFPLIPFRTDSWEFQK